MLGFLYRLETFDHEKQAIEWPILAMLVSGGVLTLAWIAFLIWAAFQIVTWAIS